MFGLYEQIELAADINGGYGADGECSGPPGLF